MGDYYNKKSEIFKSYYWTDIEQPPWKDPMDGSVDASRFLDYAVVFHGGSHYYFGGFNSNPIDSILRLDESSWTWSFVGQLNTARSGHEIILVGNTFTVVGGKGYEQTSVSSRWINVQTDACLLNNGYFTCTEQSSIYDGRDPFLYLVDEDFGNCL